MKRRGNMSFHRWIILLAMGFLFFGNKEVAAQQEMQLLFYNTENLFDTINDPIKRDDEFTPGGRKAWDSERYQLKLEMLAEAIASGTPHLPALIGLSEIENMAVLEDLVATEQLVEGNYRIIHEEGLDIRGIDVALLYNPNVFQYISHRVLHINMPFDLEYKTRDILYVKGVLLNDTIHCYVNHWPSRRGGMEESEPRRITAAKRLRLHLDSIVNIVCEPNVIIMGDLNDEPHNRSISGVLEAAPYCDTCRYDTVFSLVNLTTTIPEGEGTYFYWKTQQWNSLDHIIVSSPLLNEDKGLSVSEQRMNVVKNNRLLHKNEHGNIEPFSTFGKDYEGGYSDHLPVFISLKRSESH